MALKKYKPTSPGRRFMSVSGFEDVLFPFPGKLGAGNASWKWKQEGNPAARWPPARWSAPG